MTEFLRLLREALVFALGLGDLPRETPARRRRLRARMTEAAAAQRDQERADWARRIHARLVGARYEVEQSVQESAEHYSDALLTSHLTSMLIDAEGACQLLERALQGAACTPA